jgi:hypothetical protein
MPGFEGEPGGRLDQALILFSDLHGQVEHLRRLLEKEPGPYVSVGDVLGPRGDNLACMRMLKGLKIPGVLGNHETRLLAYYRAGLDEEALAFLATWPHELCDERALIVHTLLTQRDSVEYHDIHSPEQVKILLRRRPLVFTGHIHQPGYWEWEAFGEPQWLPVFEPRRLRLEPEHRYLIQVGSLGEPELPSHPRYVAWKHDVEWRTLGSAEPDEPDQHELEREPSP